MAIDRREFSALALAAAGAFAMLGRVGAETATLPSWSEGPAREAILKFVRATTDASSPAVRPAG